MLNNKNDINPSSNVSNRNIKRKKIDFSKSHSQLFKTANT